VDSVAPPKKPRARAAKAATPPAPPEVQPLEPEAADVEAARAEPLEAAIPDAFPPLVTERADETAAPEERRPSVEPDGSIAPVEPVQPVETIKARLATPAELVDWDEHTVASPNGHVYQSLAWGEYRAAHGRPVWHIVFDDGFRMLVVGRDRPVVGGGWAYATRGPIPDEHAVLTATRAAAAAELLADEGLDSFTVDGETPAASGLGRFLQARGFKPVEEVQASRHRMDVNLGPVDAHNSDEKTIFGSFGATTRNNIRQAERHGLRVKRLDAGGGRAEYEYESPGVLEGVEQVGLEDASNTERLLRGFYVMLDATAERRGFALASEDAFLDWSKRALAAGHMFYLQADHDVAGPVAGAVFYRHGHRLTYSLAGDRAELRKAHPGAVRLLVWRGIQIALDERRLSVDLGGIDTEGARGRPNKGDPTYGMYQFKESFGARWLDLTGAHQRTMRPMRNLAGKLIGRLTSIGR
jgi:peptidoglycan pentaglycine glycine transferase (the first glycine)